MKKFMFAAIAAMVMVSVSNVFASSRMVGNAEIAPVDTVAPDAPSDTTEVGTPIQPQATTEDSTQQETTQQQEATLLSPFDNFCVKFVKNTWKITEK